MKVLIATGIFPPDIGGPATMLKAFAEALVRNGLEVKIITYADYAACDRLSIGGQTVDIYKIGRNSILKRLSYLLQILRLANRADIIYVTDTYSVGYFAYLAKKLLKKKYIVRFAGDSAWETAVSNNWTRDYISDFQSKTYNRAVEKLKNRRKKILTGADKVIAVSKFMARIAGAIGVRQELIRVIYNSVDFGEHSEVDMNAVEQIKSRYDADTKIIVTSCRLTPWKGVDGIIKILPGLIQKTGNINFIVLGDGQELENLSRSARELNMEQNVHFLGRISHNETLKFIKAADLYILNSNYEGFSHALLDVMKCGTPIITTNAGGNPELIENGKEGLLVPYNNEEELSAACLKVLSDLQFARYLTANAKIKSDKFTWDNTVGESIKLLREHV